MQNLSFPNVKIYGLRVINLIMPYTVRSIVGKTAHINAVFCNDLLHNMILGRLWLRVHIDDLLGILRSEVRAMAAATAHPSSPPYALILLAVVAMILVVPSWLAEQSSLLEMANEISPVMVMVTPVVLILVIRWLSSSNNNCVSAFFGGGGDPSSIHRAGGSPVGVAIVLLTVLLMIRYQSSGNDEESDE